MLERKAHSSREEDITFCFSKILNVFMLFGLECNSWLSSQDPLVEYKRSERGSCRLTVRRRFGRGIDRWWSSWLTYLENYQWLFTNLLQPEPSDWSYQTVLVDLPVVDLNISLEVQQYLEYWQCCHILCWSETWGQLVFHHALDYYWLGQITVIPTLGFKTNQIIWKVLLQQYHKQGRFHNSTWILFLSSTGIYLKSLS